MFPADAKCLADDAEDEVDDAMNEMLQMQSQRSVPLEFCIRHLQKKVSHARLSFDGSIYIPFLFMFSLFVMLGRVVEEDYMIGRVLRDRMLGNELVYMEPRSVEERVGLFSPRRAREVQKSYEDIAAVGDWYDWMETVMIPNLWSCPPGGPTGPEDFLTAQGLNYLIGAVRLRTIMVNHRSCTPDPFVFNKAQENGTMAGLTAAPPLCKPLPISADDDLEPRTRDPDKPKPYVWAPIAQRSHPDWPSFQGFGDAIDCYRVTWNNGAEVTYRMDDPTQVTMAERLVVATLKVDTNLQVTEQVRDANGDLRHVRISGPVAGWISRYRERTADPYCEYPCDGSIVISDATKCEVTCINCVGPMSWTEEETAMRYDVSNPLKGIPSAARPLDSYDRFYKHYSCSELSKLGRASYYLISGDMTTAYHCGGYIVELNFNESCTNILHVMDVLRGARWIPEGDKEISAPFIDPIQSRFASAEFFVYSTAEDTISSVKLSIEIGPAGGVLPQYEFRAFKIWTEERYLDPTIFDFFFFAFVLYYLVKYVLDWKKVKKKTGKTLSFLLDSKFEAVWNWVDTVNLFILVMVFALRMMWWDLSTRSALKFPVEFVYPPNLDRVKDLYMLQTYMNSINVVLSYLKLLKYARLNSKLGVLTATISKAKDKMIGILVIFIWVVFAFAMCGQYMFGSAIWGFRTISASVVSLMFAILGGYAPVSKQDGGEGEFEDMRRENRILAAPFFWGYVGLGTWVIFNFIIGVLGEAFAEANASASGGTFIEQIVRGIVGVKKSLKPANLIQGFKIMMKKTSRAGILNNTIDHMQDLKNQLESEIVGQLVNVEDLEEGQVTRDKLKTFMGAEEYDLLGADYVEDLWDELEDQHRQFVENDAELEAHEEIKEFLKEGIQQAIRPRIDDVDRMGAEMEDVEESVDDIIQQIFDMRKAQRRAAS